MLEKFDIAGYCRISVDEEMDRDNTSIENQKSIISDYVARAFPGSTLTFYVDRDRSGYTFEQREGYQKMRPLLMGKQYDILIVKDFSRFSRRNSRGLVELEDLRDAGVRIISIGDSIDYPTYDDWVAIQFRFLVNEMPVTDASKKVKYVIKRRQEDGKWICAVPYGYVITNSKTMAFEVEPSEAEVVRKVFDLYSQGWGYKKIANWLTDQGIPTPRMTARARKEAKGEESKLKTKAEWSIATVQGMLDNDFYIGTLRQGKYTRKRINGAEEKRDESEHLVFENNHEAIVDYRTFALTQEQLKKRSTDNYRGIKKNDNVYAGFLVCGDCGSPMFAMSRTDLKEAYRCGLYHRRGLKGCTSHHVKAATLDGILKAYLTKVRENSAEMIKRLEESINTESDAISNNKETVDILEKQLNDAREELKVLTRQKVRELMRKPEAEELIEETYDELMADCKTRMDGIQNQISLTFDKRNTIIRANRIAKTALGIFDDVLVKDKLDKNDLELIIDRIFVYEDHIDVKLKPDIDSLLSCGMLAEKPLAMAAGEYEGNEEKSAIKVKQRAEKHVEKAYDVNVISEGDPLEIFTDREGEVILKKYSPIGELGDFAREYAEALHQSMGHIAVICDKDNVIAVSGGSKRELMDKPVHPELEQVMERREKVITGANRDGRVLRITADETDAVYSAVTAVPILAAGDSIGCVLLLSKEPSVAMTQTEQKACETAAYFMGKQMEN